MVQRLFIVLAREPKRTRLLPTVLDLRPGILPLSNRNQPPPMCRSLALEQLSGRRPATSVPYTDIDSLFVPGPTSQPFAGWSEVSLVWLSGEPYGGRKERRPHLLVDGAFIVYPKESNLSIPR
uniref:Uncharacterized protein n=1 Tax=Ammopiptanthus mongolicus TaxID=126911 RepID=A0A385G2D1_AMMMO|nr:hypothetical protein [Ammopiptanthus mongolicus]AXV54348.1 hypothetical protein [Ammopiptanthus mongolicus]